jgi:TIR domain
MRIFISWSGELSKELAEAVRKWLPSALQYVKPFFTPNDVDKGTKWASEIFKELSGSVVSIIVLTRENLNSNWIMFEAGAISSTIDRAKVCPLIFDLEPTDLQGPLAQFQITKFTKEDFRRLFMTINAAAGEHKLADGVAETVFQKWWPDLEKELYAIISNHLDKRTSPPLRTERKLIEEILLLVRTVASEKPEVVRSQPQNPKYNGSIYQKLIGALKYYDTNYSPAFGDDESDMHKTYVALHDEVSRRFPNSELKTGVLRDLTGPIERTSPPQKAQSKDDQIPF